MRWRQFLGGDGGPFVCKIGQLWLTTRCFLLYPAPSSLHLLGVVSSGTHSLLCQKTLILVTEASDCCNQPHQKSTAVQTSASPSAGSETVIDPSFCHCGYLGLLSGPDGPTSDRNSSAILPASVSQSKLCLSSPILRNLEDSSVHRLNTQRNRNPLRPIFRFFTGTATPLGPPAVHWWHVIAPPFALSSSKGHSEQGKKSPSGASRFLPS